MLPSLSMGSLLIEIERMSLDFLKLMVLDPCYIKIRPSQLAAASFMFSLDILKQRINVQDPYNVHLCINEPEVNIAMDAMRKLLI